MGIIFLLDGVEHEEHIRKANKSYPLAVVLVVTLCPFILLGHFKFKKRDNIGQFLGRL